MQFLEYLLRLNDIIEKRNTLDDLLSQYNNGKLIINLISAIASKYEDRKQNKDAANFYSILLEKYPNSTSEQFKNAKYFLAKYKFSQGNENSIRNYIKNNPNSDNIYNAYREMTHHYANTNELKKELAVYKEILITFPNNPNALNAYAWRMAELNINLEDALEKAKVAITLTASKPKQQANSSSIT